MMQEIKMKTEYLVPARIIALCGNIDNSETLLKEKTKQIFTDEADVCTVRGRGYFVLDFGLELAGRLRIITLQIKHLDYRAQIRIRYGESVGECMAELGEKHACNHHAPRDFTAFLPAMSDISYTDSGFRFVRIDFLEDVTLTVKSVLAVSVCADLEQKGSFVCDDALINRIFDTAKRTVLLNVQNQFIWDGIKRDRLVWTGDLHPEITSLLRLYGDIPCISASLDALRGQYPLPVWINAIPSYSMWWIINLYEYYRYTGDKEYLKQSAAYLSAVAEQICSCIRGNGSFDFTFAAPTEMPLFLDWPTYGTEFASAGVAALCRIALSYASALLEEIGLNGKEFAASALKAGGRKILRGAPKQILAMRVLSGEDGALQEAGALTECGGKGVSAFMCGYILTAAARGGKAEKALDTAREYYGGMLDRGATAFWEDFDLDWLKGSGRIDELPRNGEKDLHGDFGDHCYKGYRKSLCHGWSAGVIPFLFEEIAGIKPLSAGCGRLALNPKPGGLKYFRCVYPTPFGAVTIEYSGGRAAYTAPDGVEIIENQK